MFYLRETRSEDVMERVVSDSSTYAIYYEVKYMHTVHV